MRLARYPGRVWRYREGVRRAESFRVLDSRQRAAQLEQRTQLVARRGACHHQPRPTRLSSSNECFCLGKRAQLRQIRAFEKRRTTRSRPVFVRFRVKARYCGMSLSPPSANQLSRGCARTATSSRCSAAPRARPAHARRRCSHRPENCHVDIEQHGLQRLHVGSFSARSSMNRSTASAAQQKQTPYRRRRCRALRESRQISRLAKRSELASGLVTDELEAK